MAGFGSARCSKAGLSGEWQGLWLTPNRFAAYKTNAGRLSGRPFSLADIPQTENAMKVYAALAALLLCSPATGQEALGKYSFNVVAVGGLRPTLHLTTNAPDGTDFVTDLSPPHAPDAAARLARGMSVCVPDCVRAAVDSGSWVGEVRGGKFSIGPINFHNGSLLPGLYHLTVWLGLKAAMRDGYAGMPIAYSADIQIHP